MLQIEIDEGSGFCFGVTTAIKKAEEELEKGMQLYCLGDIGHSMEVERLAKRGLITISHDQLRELHNATVLLRAHGEPPETYELARKNNIEIIDATCPVVLALQRRIKNQYEKNGNSVACDLEKVDLETELKDRKKATASQIVIFGKLGHAEVLGLVGQTHSNAIVIEKFEDVQQLDFNRDIYLYSQTTKSLNERVSSHHRVYTRTYLRERQVPQFRYYLSAGS